MSKLYHGSLEIVVAPEIRKPDRTLDYGAGFYLTSSYDQAESWVKRKLKDDTQRGYVNVYEYDECCDSEFKLLAFDKPDKRWLRFVMANRMNPDYQHDYDIVKGPVANDRVYAQFALYEAELIDEDTLIRELRAYKLVNQILLHTTRALKSVTWQEAREVRKK